MNILHRQRKENLREISLPLDSFLASAACMVVAALPSKFLNSSVSTRSVFHIKERSVVLTSLQIEEKQINWESVDKNPRISGTSSSERCQTEGEEESSVIRWVENLT